MQLCVIAPTPHLDILTRFSRMHLVLTHWVLENSDYAEFYENRRIEGDYIILDNGAYEFTVSQCIEDLKRAADIVMPHEVVLPDALRNGMATARMSEEAYEPLVQHFDWDTKFMAVVHGKNPKEWDWCLRRQIELPVHVLGIPRVYADDFGSWIPAIAAIRDSSMRGRFDIHLLGAPHDLTHAAEVHKVFPTVVRSTDTAKPIHFAMARKRFDSPLNPDQRNGYSRPDNFITYEMDREQLALCEYNIQVFGRAIGAIS